MITVRPLREAGQRRLDLALGLRVQGARRLVEEQDGRVADHGPRQRDPLPLARRQRERARSDRGVEPSWEAGGQRVEAHEARRGLHLLRPGAGSCRRRCSPAMRPVEEQHLLGHDREEPAEIGGIDLAKVDAVERHASRRGVVEPEGEPEQRRLAAAGVARDGDVLPGADREVDAFEPASPAGVGERDVFEAEGA